MKKNKFIGIMLLSFLMVIGMAMMATAVIDLPRTGSTITTDPFNISFNSTCACNYTNYSLQVTGALSANLTKIYANISNSTQSQSNISFSWNASGLEDANDYSLIVIASNNTGSETTVAVTGIIIDFTTPTVPTALTSGRQTSSSISLTATITGSRTTACTVSFQGQIPTSSTPTCTHSGNTATVTLSQANEGSFGYQITASDGTQLTPSAVTYFNVDLGKGGKAPAQAQAQASAGGQDVASKAKEAGGVLGKGVRAVVDWIKSAFGKYFA